jgi:hypothetical protein
MPDVLPVTGRSPVGAVAVVEEALFPVPGPVATSLPEDAAPLPPLPPLPPPRLANAIAAMSSTTMPTTVTSARRGCG